MNYVEGYAYSVKESLKGEFIAIAEKSASYFLKHGALRVVEGWGDDVPDGKLTSFPIAVQKKEGEVVMFSWVEWPDKATREAAHKILYEEMEKDGLNDMPIDGKLLIFGGFQMVVDAS